MSSGIINSVAEATSHRDRDSLNQSIAALVLQHLSATWVRWHSVHEDGSASCSIQLGSDAGKATSTAGAEALPCVVSREISVRAIGRDTVTTFPIESESAVVGMLEVCTLVALTQRDEALVAGLLRILRNHVGLLDYGERDTLTGLLNRKPFESSFGRLRQRSSEHGSPPREPSWLGVIDIDHFKSINDRYGHLFGDEVLLLVARLMQETFRGADKLFRFGGEEFVVLLHEASVDGAGLAFERIRKRIEEHRFPQVGPISISLGYTQVGAKEASAECLERADAALYYCKQNGRNCVSSYESLLALGKLTPKQPSHDIELF